MEKIWIPGQTIIFEFLEELRSSIENEFNRVKKKIRSCNNWKELCLDLSQVNDNSTFSQVLKAFDNKKKSEEFGHNFFDCSICLEEKRGRDSFQLQNCGHV
jgi:hypothetical protein